MTKTSGYHVTIKAFIASPKSDFAAQARAATTMDELIKGSVITPGFVELARIVDVVGKYGSIDMSELPVLPEAPADTQEQAGETGNGADADVDADVETDKLDDAATNLAKPRQKRAAS
jgi:hypothetical protein